MDAVKFFEERERMCDSFNGNCAGCEINKYLYGGMGCDAYVRHHPEEAVAIVEKWSGNHPKKTRQSEFLKMFPDADIAEDGHPRAEPCLLGAQCTPRDRRAEHCLDCRKQFWNEEVDA